MFSINVHQRNIVPYIFLRIRNYASSETAKVGSQNTVDQSEVNFHSNLSDDWWNAQGSMKPLHAMNSIRIQFIRSGLINTGLLDEKETHNNPHYMKGLNIADIGCGGGILSLGLARLGCHVVGVEPSKDLVNIAQGVISKENPEGKTEFIASSVEEYAKQKENFHDAVICSEVIEHVTNKEEFIKTCIQILKPGGSIFFTTMNRTLPGRLLCIYAAEYLLKLIPTGTHQYDKFITPQELTQILDKHSCDTKMVNGYIYSPLDNSFYWMPTSSVLYALHGVKK